MLPNSLFGDAQLDICFIIRDGKTKKSDSIVDENVQKFEEKLRELNITNVKTILPLTKLKHDYGANNMKIKLLNTYDLFFVESEIAEHVYTILGKVKLVKFLKISLIEVLFVLSSTSSRNANAHFKLTPARLRP